MKRLLAYTVLLSCLLHCTASDPSPHFHSIFSFGNSYSDTGNFVLQESSALPVIPFNNSPYGETFFRRPTGRPCDGRLVIDFVADALGLPLLAPYLSKGRNFSSGANFAIVGGTALDLGFFLRSNISCVPPFRSSLGVQLEWFQELKLSLCNTTKECREYFDKSLFVVGEFGGNDYRMMLAAGKSLEQAKSFVPKVVQAIFRGIELLLEQGVKYVVVSGNPPMGCTPIILTEYASANKTDYDRRTGCLRRFNGLSQYHNWMLREGVERIRGRYPMAKIAYADYYKPVTRFLRRPGKFGFTRELLRACCGGGGAYNYDARAPCGLPGATACGNPSAYVSWDGIHLTESAYSYIADGWLKGIYASPSILSLVY